MSVKPAQKISIITVDGPSGVGKGTMAQWLAQELGFHLLDSGAIYRLAGLACLLQNVQPEDETALVDLCSNLDIRFETQPESKVTVFLNDIDVTSRIRTEEIAQQASRIASIPAVRSALLQRQRDFARAPGLVADGRDMGTVVFPEAPLKLFLTANAHVRAQRRFDELSQAGHSVEFIKILREIEERDKRDSERVVAPLRPADDAHKIDTSNLDIPGVQAKIKSLVEKTMNLSQFVL